MRVPRAAAYPRDALWRTGMDTLSKTRIMEARIRMQT